MPFSMIPAQAHGPSDGIAANGLYSRGEVSFTNYASSMGGKKRRLVSDDGSGPSDAKRYKVDDSTIDLKMPEIMADQSLLPSYIAKLQRWRDSLPFRAIRNELPLSWHEKPLLDVLQECPVILDLWVEKVAHGDWVFERTLRNPLAHFLPQDFADTPTWIVTEVNPSFEDVIVCGVLDGRIVSLDQEDDSWIYRKSHAREKARRWLQSPPCLWRSVFASDKRAFCFLVIRCIDPRMRI